MPKHRNPRQKISKQPPPDNRRTALPAPEFDLPGAVDLLREINGRTDALIYSAERHFERYGWRCMNADPLDKDERPVDHLAHLISAARQSASEAVQVGIIIAAELIRRGKGGAA